MKKIIIKTGAVAVLAMAFALVGCSGGSSVKKKTNPIHAVYHVNEDDAPTGAMRNIKNHMKADPTVKIVVTTHSKGVDFLFEGAKEAKTDALYSSTVEELQAKGVEFHVCANTIKGRKLDASKLLPGVKIVPSGVADLTKLQEEGYVYIKP